MLVPHDARVSIKAIKTKDTLAAGAGAEILGRGTAPADAHFLVIRIPANVTDCPGLRSIAFTSLRIDSMLRPRFSGFTPRPAR